MLICGQLVWGGVEEDFAIQETSSAFGREDGLCWKRIREESVKDEAEQNHAE